VFIKKTTQNILRLACLLACFSGASYANAENPKTKAISNPTLPVCVYIASYSPDYIWQNGIERGIKKVLDGKCQLKTFFMNTKKVFKKSSLESISLQAVDYIATNKPNIVIVSDDNAVKYVLERYYKNSDIPFVFCGVNNTVKNYGLPYQNTTGMVEKNPTRDVLKLLFDITPSKTRVAMITTYGTTANSDTLEFKKLTQKLGLKSKVYQVKNEQEWRKRYKEIQEGDDFDILYLANRSTFNSWDHKKNYEWALKYNQKFSFTLQDWMVPYAAIGLTKIPDEQGIWAAKAALDILNGANPTDIAIVPNQNFQFWINKQIAKRFENLLPENIFSQSLIYNEKPSK